MSSLLEGDIQTAEAFCSRVVDVAIQAADTAVLLSMHTAKVIGLDGFGNLVESGSLFAAAADIACNIELRRAQMLLDDHVASQNSSSAVDYQASGGVCAVLPLLFCSCVGTLNCSSILHL